jgi:hypothetical protein
MKRAALYERESGLFLSDRGIFTLRLHHIKIFNADEGHDSELRLFMHRFPSLEKVECEGDWCKSYNVVC